MHCPNCTGRTRVLETRMATITATRRRYECANGHRFTTMEHLLDTLPERATDKKLTKPVTVNKCGEV